MFDYLRANILHVLGSIVIFFHCLLTGSGKTYTMQPLPLRATEDIVHLLHQPFYRDLRYKLWLSYFEIYGGKLFDLLCDRRFA